MALAITIDGVDVVAADLVDLGRGTPAFEETLQARGLFSFAVKDRVAPGGYRPALGQTVIATLDGVRIWGGRINRVQEQDWGDYRGTWCTLEVGDWTVPLETIFFNGTLAGPTLRALLQELVTARFPAGYTVLPAMAEGPTLGPQGFGFAFLRDILDAWGAQAGWSWTVNHQQQVYFAATGTIPAGISFLADNDTINRISLDHDFEGYVNTQWLHYGSGGNREVTDTWHGDSSTRLFPVSFPQPTYVMAPPPTATLNGAVKPVGVWGVDTGLEFYWRASDAALIQDFALPVLTPADTLTATYVANFPGAVVSINTAGVTAHGERAMLDTAPDVFDVQQAQQLCDGLLAQRDGLARKVHITTHLPGVDPGMSVLVNVPERNVNASCLCLAKRFSHDGRKGDGTDFWKFDLELVASDRYVETWQKFWQKANAQSGQGQSGSGTVSPPLPPTGGGDGGGGTTTGGSGPAYGGGSRAVAITQPGIVGFWQPVPEFVDVLLPASSAALLAYTFRCHAWLVRAGGTVTVRVVALESGGIVCGTGTAKSATDWSDPQAFHEFTVTLRPATQYYRVEVLMAPVGSGEAYIAGCTFYPGGVI